MKKILCLALAMIMMLGSTLLLASCNNPKDPSDIYVPKGYQLYNNGYVAFVYPESWEKIDGDTVILMNEAGIGNNITIVFEQKNDAYSKMTADDFKKQMAESNIDVSDPEIEKKTNKLGTDVINVTYSVEYSGIKMTQTMYVVNSGDRTYIVTITETKEDEALVKNVLDSLMTVK